MLPTRVHGELSDMAVKTVSLGLGHTAAIVDEGTLYTWGAGWKGRLGHNDQTNVYSPKRIASMVFKQFISVSWVLPHLLSQKIISAMRGAEEMSGLGLNPKLRISLSSCDRGEFVYFLWDVILVSSFFCECLFLVILPPSQMHM